MTPEQGRLTAGCTFGPYRVDGLIGAGGMGEVYRAHDPRLQRDVAIKVLTGSASSDPDARRRLLREARAAAALNHPHVCTIHEVGEADGQAYIAMELIEGESVDRLLPASGFPLDRALRYGLQITEAVAHAHERGIVHRDLKSANAVITPQGHAKVLDFGLARRLSGVELAEVATQTQSLTTAPGAIVGTLPYMAPEQVRGEPADVRSDVWALGVMLYELVAGVRPFSRENAFALSAAILSETPASLPDTVPSDVGRVIERCLAKTPDERYQRAGELAAALEELRAGVSVPRGRFGRRTLLLAPGAVLGVAVVIAALGMERLRQWLPRADGSAPAAIRLAVLPFANLTGDPGQEYFSDGLTEEMIGQLGRLHPQRLTVIGRTSAMRYKRTDKAINEIGLELGVDYVLEGSARREGSRVRITAQLVRTSDQTQTWSDTYERELAGMFALQSDVARGVAGSLALALLPAVQTRLANARAVIPEAYEAYLKGREHSYRLTVADLDTALQYFERALAADPNFALAYAGVASVWGGRRQMGFVPAATASPNMEAAVRKALELDDSLAEAHWTLGGHRAFGLYDWAGAEQAFQRALAIDPNHADTLASYSHVLSFLGRHDEALAHAARAVQIEPYSAFHQAFYAVVLKSVRRYDEAIEQIQRALRTSPGLPFAHTQLVAVFHRTGRHAEAVAALRQAAIARGDRELEQAVARAYAEEGYQAMWRRAADLRATRFTTDQTRALRIAGDYLRAGETDRALDWLEKAYEARDPNMYGIASPEWDAVRDHPRFQGIWKRVRGPA